MPMAPVQTLYGPCTRAAGLAEGAPHAARNVFPAPALAFKSQQLQGVSLATVVRSVGVKPCAASRKLPSRISVRADQLATGGAETHSGFVPGAPFYKVEAILRPWRIKYVCRALLEQGIRGVTVADVRGFGAQGGSRERQAGSEFTDDSLVVKAKLEVVVIADQIEDVIKMIITEARTGEIGDGKIFVSPVSEIIRVRTGERGVEAERMAGGRQELLNKSHLFLSPDGKEAF